MAAPVWSSPCAVDTLRAAVDLVSRLVPSQRVPAIVFGAVGVE